MVYFTMLIFFFRDLVVLIDGDLEPRFNTKGDSTLSLTFGNGPPCRYSEPRYVDVAISG